MSTGNQLRAFLLVVQEEEEGEEEDVEEEGASNAMLPPIVDCHQQPVVTMAAIRSLIQTASADDISSVAASLKEKQLVLSVRHIEYQGEVIAKELTRDPRTLDADTRAEWNRIHNTWETAWHGTRYKYL